MLCLVTVFVFTVYGTYGCVVTSPDQMVIAGTDVDLSCNFRKCPGLLDVPSLSLEWEFQNISSEAKIILYFISDKIVSTPGVYFRGDVKSGRFDAQLSSVTHENTGTYLCRLRLNGVFHRAQTHIAVRSAQSRRNSPSGNLPEAHPVWWLPLVSAASGFVVLIATIFLGRKAYRSFQSRHSSKQSVEEVQTSSDSEGMGVRCKVAFSSMPVLSDMDSPPSSPDNTYVTMHGWPFTPDAPVTAGRGRRLPSDWQPETEESVYACTQQEK